MAVQSEHSSTDVCGNATSERGAKRTFRCRSALVISLMCSLMSMPGHAADPAPRPGSFALAKPKYKVELKQNIMVPLRDGVHLATDIYRPVGVDGPLPIIFYMRGGYPKSKFRPNAEDRTSNVFPTAAEGGYRNIFREQGIDLNELEWFASQGYIVAVQDARGKYDSEGSYTLVKNYQNDLYDSVDWLSKQKWSTGKVGTIGCSYAGEVQLYMVGNQHPALKTMIPQASGTSTGSAGGFYQLANSLGEGMRGVAGDVYWYYTQLHKVRAQPPAGLSSEQWNAAKSLFDLTPKVKDKTDQQWSEIFNSLPEIDMLKKAGMEPGGVQVTDWRLMTQNMIDIKSPFWKQFNFVEEGAVNKVPSLFITSWYDIEPRADLYLRGMFEKTAVNADAKAHQHVIVTPTPHCRSETTTADYNIGDLRLGDARFGIYSVYLSWFDHWLKGIDNDVATMPKIQFYEMGTNVWRAADSWPLKDTRYERLFLRSGGKANSYLGDGLLSPVESRANEPADTFTYDPANPVQTLSGSCFSGHCFNAEVADQRSNTVRQDVLVYTSQPYAQGVHLTGPLDTVLYLSSSAKDTDLFVVLNDVQPDGTALNIVSGRLRVRYREGREKSVLMTPGDIYKVPIRMGATSMFVKPRHRLQLSITSSDFPAWGRNLNTGGRNFDETRWVSAVNAIHHQPGQASYVTLPIVSFNK